MRKSTAGEKNTSLVTRQVLAYALKNLLRTEPLSKITVGDICEACGMNRKSFYYHFHDKHDLIRWIFETEYSRVLMSNAAPGEEVLQLCVFLNRNGAFCRAVLREEGQNSLSEVLAEHLTPVVNARVGSRFARDPYAAFYTDLYVRFLRDAIVRWVLDGCAIAPEKFTAMLYQSAAEMPFLMPDASAQAGSGEMLKKPLDGHQNICYNVKAGYARRDGRAVEGAGLENQ